ncbi:hypothetical protein QTJ16_006187 [Diplocarpon rosae]|uniref:F-box domain-containing protein n=1 Tax=Diplocarpon rosae TaxID=946125 RepID=A0AAD9SVI4_9HELO|nr:hypothetical protein QTJ16_006187 [Diplocarpon rosae]PBP23968.1 f-box domain containing protein [Diplocarpon rosae]
MVSSASELSMDSSDTSPSADSTSADSLEQEFLNISEPEDPTDMATAIDSDDSDSDVSMSAETEDEEDVGQSTSIAMVNQNLQALNLPTPLETPSKNSEASKKRKFSDSREMPNGLAGNDIIKDFRKRLKPDDASQKYRHSDGHLLLDKSNLPAEIWHHIFTFCAPKTLGRLLQVSKCFRAYLEPSSSGRSISPLSISAARLLSPDNIWRISRQGINLHGLPAPLSGKSELDMWKMFCGSTCQFCHRRTDPSVTIDQWHPGPGEDGVAPIWSFGIRACGSCLQKKSTKEIDLLLSSSIASPLMAALPFIFLTNELHVVSSDTLRSAQRPPSVQITKYFFNLQVEDIKKEFEEVKTMGSATAEEWLKGLDRRGQDRRNDAARWERWDKNGGIERIRSLHKVQQPKSVLPQVPLATTLPKNTSLPPHPGHNAQFSTHLLSQKSFATNPPPRYESPAQVGFASFPPRPQAQAKHERTKEEVAEMRAARKADIERRCLLLEPPITPEVLAHMPSFQAAIQIIQPLVENSWEVLKMRLIAQREDAEQRENERLAQTRVAQERIVELRFHDLRSKPDSKDLVEKEWDDMQIPLRSRISGYADEIIRDGWNGGEKVSYDTSPLFAAEVLIYVRKRFYADVAKDEAAVRAIGREPEQEPSNGPTTRKLFLENMKWVFDTKIKPHTEQYRKELFICNACEYANKYYGFEGVIQHYAAKHTSTLSVGSVVVHWKSEWPEISPFHPNPNSIAAKPDYSAGPSASAPYMSTGSSLPQNFGYGGYPTSAPTPIPVPNLHGYQESPGPYYGHPQPGDQYSSHQNGPFPPPPQQYQNQSQTYQPPQYSVASQEALVPGYNDTQEYSQTGYGAQYHPSQQAQQDMYVTSHSAGTLLSATPDILGQQGPYASSSGQRGSCSQPPSYGTNNIAQVARKSEQYMAQLQYLARNARDIWNSIGSIKEVPGSLKVYTIIYHLLNRYRETYQEAPPLSMMVDGLSSNKDMRPVRNVNGLLCKACTLGMAGSVAAPQKKHFSFPQLVNHFHSIHEVGASQRNYGHVPDWTKDMVCLPDLSKLKAVVNAPGMDDQKLELFTEAVPEITAVPGPLASDLHCDTRIQYAQYDPQNDYQHLAPSQGNHDKYYSGTDDRISASRNVNFDNGEYDPKRPGDLLVEPRPPRPAQGQHQKIRERKLPNNSQTIYDRQRYEDEQQEAIYQEHHSRSIFEPRPSALLRVDPAADYGRVVTREEPSVNLERRVRYYDSPDVEYRVHRDAQVLTYEEPELVYPGREYRTAKSRSYYTNRRDQTPPTIHDNCPGDSQLQSRDDDSAQQNQIYDVVAQISQQAQRARKQPPTMDEVFNDGSEDGEVRMEGSSNALPQKIPSEKASNAAERFLGNFRSGEESGGKAKDVSTGRREDECRSLWEDDRGDNARLYRAPIEPQRRARDELGDYRGRANSRCPGNTTEDLGRYTVHERTTAPRPVLASTYEERYTSAVTQETRRDRSPEIVDRRYKLNNAVYRDERQGSQGIHRTPSRYARYESVRLENDRALSRSPLYVKLGTLSGQYRETSSGPHPAHALRPEPTFRSRTPPQQVAGDVPHENPPRQEYYRVYADEPRAREPQYTEAYEFVRVSDPQGDYMIRRPVRREPEPVYDTYENDIYRQPVYGSLAPPATSRTQPMFYEEEYDPHHPAPPLPPTRQIRYQ